MYSLDSDYFFFPLFFTERLPCHLWKPGGWRHRAHSEPRPARTLNGCPTRLLAARTHPMMLHGKARPARGSSVPTSGQGLNPIFSTVPNRTKTPQKWFQGFPMSPRTGTCLPRCSERARSENSIYSFGNEVRDELHSQSYKYHFQFEPSRVFGKKSAVPELKTIFIALEMKSR